MVNYKVLDLEFSSGADPFNISNVLGVKSSVVAEYYAGYTDSSTNLLDVSGNSRTLTAAGSPTIAATALLDQDRNPLKSVVLNGSSQGFSRVHDAWMNMFTADFTASFVINAASAGSGQDDFLYHGDGTNGIKLYVADTTGYATAVFYPASVATVVGPSTNLRDGYYHVVHVVRSSNTATVYLDGVAGTPISVVGKGTNVSASLYLGMGVTYLQGGLLYARLQTSAFTSTQVSIETAYWKGLAGGKSTKTLQLPTFSRSGTSLVERATGPTSVVTANTNWPVKSPEGGMLVQGAVTQELSQTNAFATAPWSAANTVSASTVGVIGVRPWIDIACSSDGSIMVAVVNGGYIYTSADSGASWTARKSAGYSVWAACAISSNGLVMYAVGGTDKVTISTDSGVTWTHRYPTTTAAGYTFTDVSCSSTGAKATIVAPLGGQLYYTSDTGSTWTKNPSSGANPQYFNSCGCDSTGDIVFATTGSTLIYKSITGGASFSSVPSGTKAWLNISVDATGLNVAAITGAAGYVYVSVDSGANWFERTGAGSRIWLSVSCAGANLIVSADYYLYTSTDSGVNWTQRTFGDLYYGGLTTIDSDGSVFAYAGYSYYGGATLSRSIDSGVTWAECADPGGDYFPAITSLARDDLTVATNSTGDIVYVYSFSSTLFKSIDGGTNWTQLINYSKLGRIAASSDGSRIVTAPLSTGYLATSSDYGSTFAPRYSAGARSWNRIGSSGNGAVLAAAGAAAGVYISRDYGVTWDVTAGLSVAKTWWSIAASTTGAKLAVCQNLSDNIYTSSDYGVTWTPRGTARVYSYVASDSSGDKLVAVVSVGYIYTSIDQGANWTERTVGGATKVWSYVASSGDGSLLVACNCGSGFGGLWVSTNSGVNWTECTSLKRGNWQNIQISSDGAVIYATGRSLLLYKSINQGTTWTEIKYDNYNTQALQFGSIASSSDGTKLISAETKGSVYLSTNSGATWTRNVSLGQRSWQWVSSSADGAVLLATAYGNSVYLSINSGATWTAQAAIGTRNWWPCAVSSNGQFLIAGVYSGYIYTSPDQGANWTERNPAGIAKLWTSIACDSDGSHIIASGTSVIPYISTDSGVSWNAPSQTLASYKVACNADGSRMFSAVYGAAGYLWTYSGSSWVSNTAIGTKTWTAISCYGNNVVLLADTATPDYPYCSTDSGVTYFPCLNAGVRSWYAGLAAFATGFYAHYRTRTTGDFGPFIKANFATLASAAVVSSPLAPDGTAANFKFVATTDNVHHFIMQIIILTAAYYTVEVDVIPGDKDWFYLGYEGNGSTCHGYFNLNGSVGEISSGCVGTIRNVAGRIRCGLSFVGSTAIQILLMGSVEGDGVKAFAGDGSTPGCYIWEASCHLNQFQSLPINRTVAAASRAADSLTYPITFFPGYFLGNTYHNKSLTIELRVKCQYKDTNDIGANTYRPFITIGGNTGTALITKNHISIRAYNQYVYADFYSNDSTTRRYMSHIVTDANKWHVYRAKFDFSDLSLSTFTKDDAPYTGSADLSSTHNLDVTNCLLRIGQDYAGIIAGHCEIDYVKIWVGT